MKKISYLPAFLLAFCFSNLHAQYIVAPQPPSYPVIYQSGASLAQVIDTMYAHADVTDTSEGNEMSRIAM